MASDKNKKNVEVTKDVHTKLTILKATHDHKTLDETIQYLMDNQSNSKAQAKKVI